MLEDELHYHHNTRPRRRILGLEGRLGSGASSVGDDDLPIPLLSPAQYELLDSAHSFTLEFQDPGLERAYKKWRRVRMAKIDVAAMLTLLLFHATQRATTLGRSDCIVMAWLPCIALGVPLGIAMYPGSKKFYAKFREVLVALVYCALAFHQHRYLYLNSSSTSTTTETTRSLHEVGNNLLLSMEGVWVSALSIILHVHYPWQTLMLMINWGVSVWTTVNSVAVFPYTSHISTATTATTTTTIVRHVRHVQTSSIHVGIEVLSTLLLQVCIPGIVLYVLEYGARKVFCASPMASYWAWSHPNKNTKGREKRPNETGSATAAPVEMKYYVQKMR